ncbi:MAG: PHP domain-containing protein, partial [Dehalococcoidia bacterium]
REPAYNRRVLIDLHTHTKSLSWDSTLSPDELIEREKQAGIDGICLTEHDFFWDFDAAIELGKRHDFLVIPAVEINTEDGHVLCFGLEKYVYGMHRWHELARHVQEAHGAMIAAHPYRRQMPWDAKHEDDYRHGLEKACLNPAYALCAGIEVINGRGKAIENQFSAELCHRLGMPASASSDSHSPGDIGKCATEFLRPVSCLEELIVELQAGRFRPVALNAS